MDERRDGTAGTRGIYDLHPAWRWVDAIAWLGDLMYQEVMGEPYEDVHDYLIANPCDEYWCIGHDFDLAVTTLVVESVASDPDGASMACDYLDGLRPPAWSRCSRFLEEGLAAGDIHDIGVEMDPRVSVSLGRLVDDIPIDPGDRWGEILGWPDEAKGIDDPLRLEMARWLDGLGAPGSIGDATRYMELNPPGHLWGLGWWFDRALLRRLAVEMAFCEVRVELLELSTVLNMPDDAKDVSLVERLRLSRVWFLDSCERVHHEGTADDSGDAAERNGAALEWSGGLLGADGTAAIIRYLEKCGPDESYWDIECFDVSLISILREKGVYSARLGKLRRMLELLDPPQGSETRRWFEERIGEKQRGRLSALFVAALVFLVVCLCVCSFTARLEQRERAQQIQEDLKEIRARQKEADAVSDGEDDLALEPGARDAADRLYDMLDPEYVPTTE